MLMDGLTPPTTRADKHGVMYVFAETDSAMRYPLHGCAAIASQLSPVRGAPPSLVLLSLLFFFFFYRRRPRSTVHGTRSHTDKIMHF